MSVPPGYNPSASMIAPSSGAIHAMSGGFMSSPYPTGINATNASSSMIPDVKGTIDSYRGGAYNMELIQLGGSEEEDITVAVAVAMMANESNGQKDSVKDITTDEADEAVAAAVAAADAEAVAAADAVSVAIMANEEVNKAKPLHTTDDEDDDDDDEEKNKDGFKTIDIFGTPFTVPDPSIVPMPQPNSWDDLLQHLHLHTLPDMKDDFIKMIYNSPSCLSRDITIAMHLQCEPIRELIQTITMNLLLSGIDDDTRHQIEILFNPDTSISGLSESEKKTIDILFKPSETIKELSEVTTAATTGPIATTATTVPTTATTGPIATTTAPTAATTATTVPTTAATATTVATTTAATATTVVPIAATATTAATATPSESTNQVLTTYIEPPQPDLLKNTGIVISTLGIRNEPDVACYAITSIQYLFSIDQFRLAILNHDVRSGRTPLPNMNYVQITNEYVRNFIANIIKKNTQESYKMEEKRIVIKDALYYIIVTLLNNSTQYVNAPLTFKEKENENISTSLGKAVMFLMMEFILYLNSSSNNPERFHTQQSAADFIRFIREACQFNSVDDNFRITTTSTLKNGIPKPENHYSLILPRETDTIPHLVQKHYLTPEPVQYEGSNVTQTRSIDLSKTLLLHITINKDTSIPVTVESNIILENRSYSLIGVILHTGGAVGGHYRYVRVISKSNTLNENPCILYNDNNVTYYETVSDDLVTDINTNCCELLYEFQKISSGGKRKRSQQKRIIRRKGL